MKRASNAADCKTPIYLGWTYQEEIREGKPVGVTIVERDGRMSDQKNTKNVLKFRQLGKFEGKAVMQFITEDGEYHVVAPCVKLDQH